MLIRYEYDVVVVGGGPAGSIAARYAASRGAHVALFEKDREIGIPVRCAEGVSEPVFRQYVDFDERWVANRIDKFKFHSPDGKTIIWKTPTPGVILNRRLFDHDLAVRAAHAGAKIFTKAYVSGLMKIPDGYTVHLKHLDREYQIRAKIVIAADGVESRVARWAGIRTQLKLQDIEPCVQILAGNIDVDQSACEFYFSTKWAPGGYVWIFPKGQATANIGLGINGKYAGQRTPLDCLVDFMSDKFPEAVALTTTAGGVPVARPLKNLVADNLVIVGDAAHQVNPLTGGGISSALASGKLAGEVVAEAIRTGDYSRQGLQHYQEKWDATIGADLRHFYRLKEWVCDLNHTDFNSIAGLLENLPPEDITLTKIFKIALLKKPGLIVDALKVFAGF